MNKAISRGTGSLTLVLAVLLVLVWNPGCRKRSPAEEEKAPAEAREPPQAVEVQKGQAPVLGLTVNRLGEVDSFQGWPVLVELELRHPKLLFGDKTVEAMVIASRGESWVQAITLTAKNSQDEIVDFPFKLKPPAEESLTLDAEKMGSLTWWLAGEATRTIPEGDYKLVAALDTTAVKRPGIWKGKVRSEPAILHLSAEPSSLDEDQAEEKQILLAAYAQATGDRAGAMAFVDALLAARPESLQGLAMKAGLVEEAGDKMGALKIYEQAISIYDRKYPKADPPYELWDAHNRLVAELLKK